MASLNKVFLLGNLTRDPDFRGLPSGQSVCTLGLAVNRRFMGSNGQEQEESCFVDVSVWGKTAQNCRQYLSKGSQVMVEGRLKLDSWDDRNGGGRRTKLTVVAENIQFMSRRSREDNPGDNGAYPPVAESYNAPGNGYSAGGYQQNNQGGFPMPQDNYRQSAPPMPDAGNYGRPGSSNAPEDDIPF